MQQLAQPLRRAALRGCARCWERAQIGDEAAQGPAAVLPTWAHAVPPALPRGVAGGARCAPLRASVFTARHALPTMSAPHWSAKESSKSAFHEALEKAQRPRLAAGHEFIGRRLLRFRRGGGDSKEKTSGRVRGVRDDPGRGRLFAVLWDDRPGVTEEVRAPALLAKARRGGCECNAQGFLRRVHS